MPCIGHLCGGTEGELSASLCPRCARGLSLEVQYVLCQQWVLYVWESGYALERVRPDPWSPRLSCSLRSWEIQGLLASPPHAPHKVTFRGTLFPPNPKHTTLFFPGRRPGKVGVHMRGCMVLVTPHVRAQPGSSSQAHSQGTHWLLSHKPTRYPCMCGLRNSHIHTFHYACNKQLRKSVTYFFGESMDI